MSHYKRNSTIGGSRRFPQDSLELPPQLRKELGLSPVGHDRDSGVRQQGNDHVPKYNDRAGSRKERRRLKREEKKSVRGQKSRVTVPERDALKDSRTVKLRVANGVHHTSIKPPKSILKKHAMKLLEHQPAERTPDQIYPRLLSDPPASSEDSPHTSRSSSPELRLDATSRTYKDRMAEDDAEIAALEKRLGHKGKKVRKDREDDFDDLLGGLDGDSRDVESRKRKREENDWLKGKRQRLEGVEQEEESHAEGYASSAEDFDALEESSSGGSRDSNELEVESDDDEAPVLRIRENPYVPPVPVPPSSQKYVPPSLRKLNDSDSESLIRLRRQIQGLLNKLSEANLISILQELEKLYGSNPRQSVTGTLIDLTLSLICDPSALQNTFIILYAGFVAGVYKVAGTGFGAELIATFVSRFENLYQKAPAKPSTSKETSNIISFLSHLYTFHVTSSVLIFDYVRLFLTSVSELNTELLLKIVRDCGSQLRQDDPSSLKDVVLILQKLAAKANSAGQEMSVRTKFTIETITDLKNNKMKSSTFASNLASEHITRMRKTLSSLGTRRTLRATEPVRISLADIQNRDKRGQWWLIGASWKDPSLSVDTDTENKPSDQLENAELVEVTASIPTNEPNDDDNLFLTPSNLPRQMNTPTRRAVFAALTSANDYIDALSRLRHLRLKRTQEMEVPRVLLHCATAEGSYNPYYTLVAREWCRDRRGRVGLQFALWGMFRRWGEGISGTDDLDAAEEVAYDEEGEDGDGGGLSQVVCLAKLFGALVSERALPLTVLKTLDFWQLGRKARGFVEVLLVCIFVSETLGSKRAVKVSGEAEAKAIFGTVAKDTPQLVPGLKWFLKSVVKKCDLVDGKGERRRLRKWCVWAVRGLETVAATNGEREAGEEAEEAHPSD